MILPDGSIYPQDYAVEVRPDARGDLVYRLNWADSKEVDKYTLFESTKFGGTRPIIPYDDHPVVRAYRRIAETIDLRQRAHREIYLSFVALATPADDHGVISTFASKIQDAIQEQNEMDDLEAHLARLDAIERRQDRIEGELTDDARAQGDAIAREGYGVLTMEIPR